MIFTGMRQKSVFTKILMQWNESVNNRTMPWKGEKDPYKVWLSEIILQQTRVEQGWAYFEKFVQNYPTINALANADDEAVFKLWEGLGYYNRCKNLLFTARFIHNNLNDQFPSSYDDILQLKGVGPYTAAAIASFCFNQSYAVVDGNVFRVLARFFGIHAAIDGNDGKKIFATLAHEQLDKSNPGKYNQAIMDFGATVCKPSLPLCHSCMLRKKCIAYEKGLVNALPIKEKTLQKKQRWFTYVLFERNNKMLVRKRIENDIWQNLFEFYLIETDDNPKWSDDSIKDFLFNQFEISSIKNISIFNAEPQQLTHQTIKGWFIKIQLHSIPPILSSNEFNWVTKSQIAKIAFPKFINQFLLKV
jgi:A/G-specific adenine glycosylase